MSEAVCEPAPVVVTITNAGGDVIAPRRIPGSAPSSQARGVPKDQRLLIQRLPVVEVLIVGKALGGVADMDHASHVRMKQADKFEVAGSRENDGIRWRRCEPARIFGQQ